MVNKTRSVPMIFNHVRWGNDLLARRLEMKLTGVDISTLISFDKTQLYRYERGDEANPKMRHFLEACNLYDLDPREYFELER